jgi:hypothetical protein
LLYLFQVIIFTMRDHAIRRIFCMIFFVLLIVLGMTFAIIHGICVHRFGVYLRKYHPLKWKELSPKKFMGISKESLESRNYFAEMRFVLSHDDLNDSKVATEKRRIKLFLFLAIASWLCMFLSLLFT